MVKMDGCNRKLSSHILATFPDRTEENHKIPSYQITSFCLKFQTEELQDTEQKCSSTQPQFSVALITSRSTCYFSGILLLSLPVSETLKQGIMRKLRNESLLMTNRDGVMFLATSENTVPVHTHDVRSCGYHTAW